MVGSAARSWRPKVSAVTVSWVDFFGADLALGGGKETSRPRGWHPAWQDGSHGSVTVLPFCIQSATWRRFCKILKPEKVRFSDLNSVMPKNRVGHYHVEVEIRQCPGSKIRQPLHLERTITHRNLDVAVLGAVESARGNGFQILDRSLHARAQLFHGRLLVLEARRLLRRKPSAAVFCRIAGNLNLS